MCVGECLAITLMLCDAQRDIDNMNCGVEKAVNLCTLQVSEVAICVGRQFTVVCESHIYMRKKFKVVCVIIG